MEYFFIIIRNHFFMWKIVYYFFDSYKKYSNIQQFELENIILKDLSQNMLYLKN